MPTINWLALGVILVVPAVAVLSLRKRNHPRPKTPKTKCDQEAAPSGTLNDHASDIAQRHLEDPHYIHYN